MISKELVAASSVPLVLSILAANDSYGYAISRTIRETSEGELAWADGMLYPVLHRLEAHGLVRAAWRRAETGRRRKYYSITKLGRGELRRHRQQWLAVYGALERLSPEGNDV